MCEVLSVKPYDIEVEGCDDSTTITADLTPRQLAFLAEIAEKITAASEISCMPRMKVRPHIHDDDCTEDHQ